MARPAQLENRWRVLVESAREPLPYSPQHQRVLSVAMELMAERGYAAASLRELARRLGISQPSLYHYFESKEALVEQIVRMHAALAVRADDDVPEAPTLRQGLRYALRRMIQNFQSERHVAFTRFLFAVGHERPQIRNLGRTLLYDRGIGLVAGFLELFAETGELRAQDCRPLAELVTNAMLMRLMGRYVLFTGTEDIADMEHFADFVLDCALEGVRARVRSTGASC